MPTPAKEIDLQKYSGTWHEISKFPNRFERGCENVTATYIPQKKYIKGINACQRNGQRINTIGKAFPVKGSKNTKLKVQFFWPIRANYWIYAIDENHQSALVGNPSKKYL